MFEKDAQYAKYIREDFTFEEKLFEKYMALRKVANEYENFKYAKPDNYATSEDFKQGFIAGVKVLSSILIDI